MRWKRDLRELRPRTRFLWFPMSIGEDSRWLERASWVEKWEGPEWGWEPIAWLQFASDFEFWLIRHNDELRDEHERVVSDLAEEMGHTTQGGPSTVRGPLCVCGASPCVFRFGTDLCPHDRIVSEFDGTRGTSSWACHGCGLSGNGPSPAFLEQQRYGK